MSDTTYNGWSNYETWVANLWLDNEESSQVRWAERAAELVQDAIDADDPNPKEDAISVLAGELEADHDEMLPETVGVFSDLLNHVLGCVDWREIAESMLSDIDVYSAGWNLPGCMPDNAPWLFTDDKSARAHISDAMDNAADALDDSQTEEYAALNAASLTVLKGSGEYGQTVGQFHYFITKL